MSDETQIAELSRELNRVVLELNKYVLEYSAYPTLGGYTSIVFWGGKASQVVDAAKSVLPARLLLAAIEVVRSACAVAESRVKEAILNRYKLGVRVTNGITTAYIEGE